MDIWKYFFSIEFANNSSKSSPPRLGSPPEPITLKIPSESFNIDTSNVPPPRSKTKKFPLFFFVDHKQKLQQLAHLLIF